VHFLQFELEVGRIEAETEAGLSEGIVLVAPDPLLPASVSVTSKYQDLRSLSMESVFDA